MVSESAPRRSKGSACSVDSTQIGRIKRADERTRTADLLITSDPSGVARVCRRLQIPHIQMDFSAPACTVLHRIALAVVSGWYQNRSRRIANVLTRVSCV